jgi:hypothetical protein
MNATARDFQAAVHALDMIPLGTDFVPALIGPAVPAKPEDDATKEQRGTKRQAR